MHDKVQLGTSRNPTTQEVHALPLLVWQVKQGKIHALQLLVDESLKVVLAEQFAEHTVASRKYPEAQDKQLLLVGPKQRVQAESHAEQVTLRLLVKFTWNPLGQPVGQ